MSDWLTPKVKAQSYYGILAFCQKTKPINGHVYQDVLEFGVCPQIGDTENETGMLIIFQQDGALQHFTIKVRGVTVLGQ
jgi:hypothetical protein